MFAFPPPYARGIYTAKIINGATRAIVPVVLIPIPGLVVNSFSPFSATTAHRPGNIFAQFISVP